MFIKSFKSLGIYKNLLKKDINGREINLYKLENFIFQGVNLNYPNILLYDRKELILPLLERTMSLKENRLDDFEIVEKDIQKEYKEPLFFFCYNLGNYYHFLYDSLPYLISFLELKKEIKNLKLLINREKCFPFVYEFLEILDIKKEDLIILDSETLYNEIYISTSYTHDINSNSPPRKEIFDFYQNMIERVKYNSSLSSLNERVAGSRSAGSHGVVRDKDLNIELYDKIYISRRTHLHGNSENIGTNYTTRRKLVNEDKLVEKLVSEGYVEIFTENLTTVQKILLFNNAKNICGCIGGGIANVVFCKKEANLEAIISPGFLDVNNRFKYCLDWVNVDYNFKTKHVEEGEFKKYMRVEYKVKLGEIEDYDEEYLYIKIDKYNTGWENDKKYEIMKVKKEEVKKLDNGLNSKFIISL